MWRLVFFLSAIGIAISLIARWWFGLRILAEIGRRPCQCDLTKWMPAPDDAAIIHRADGTAEEFGRQLRLKAIADWKETAPKAAKSRENSRRFGQAVPPLSGIVAILAVLVAKLPMFGSIAIVVGATALASILGLLALFPELNAITTAAKKLREEKGFPNRDDEDAVIESALAHAWKESLPPVLQMIQK